MNVDSGLKDLVVYGLFFGLGFWAAHLVFEAIKAGVKRLIGSG